MFFVLGFFSALLVIVMIIGCFLLSDLEGSLLKLLKKQLKKMDDKIYKVKNELEEVKMTEKVDILNQILDTIDDYETIKHLEENKEKAKQSKENAQIRQVGLDLINEDDPKKRKELKTLGQEIADIDPVLVIDLQEERKKEQEEIEKFQEKKKARNKKYAQTGDDCI